MIQLPFVGTRHEMTEYNSSMESGSSAEETSSLVHPISNASEASMWEGWTQASNGDEVATSNLLPELMGSSRLAYHQTDMLSSWLSGFHPLSQGGLNVDLSHNTDSVDNPPAFMQESLQVPALCSTTVDSLADMYIRSNAKTSSGTLYSVTNDPCEDFSESYVKRGHDSSHFGYGKPSAPLQLLQSLDPESPSSPLALHNGLLHSFGGSHWDGGHHNIPWPGATGPLSQSQATTLQLLHGPRESTAHVHQMDTDHIHAAKRDLNLPNGNNGNAYYNDYHPRTLAADHSRGLTNHLGESFVNKIGHHGGHPEVFIGSQGNYGWAPHYLKEATESCVSPSKLVPSVPDARESNIMSTGPTRSQDLKFLRNEDRISGSAVSSNIGNCTGHDSSVEQARPGKHRLELVEVDGEDADSPPLKRPSLNVSLKSSSRQMLASCCLQVVVHMITRACEGPGTIWSPI